MKFALRFSLFLAPTIWRSAFSLLILPLTTYKLEAADFGVFALVTGISAYFSALASGGTGYPIHAHYRLLAPLERKRLVSTLMFWSLANSALLAAAMIAAWPLLEAWFSDGTLIPKYALWFGAAHVVLGTPWTLAISIITLRGTAAGFAVVTMIEATLGPIATVMALYLFDLGPTSLFIGNVVSASVTLLGAFILLRDDFSPRLSGTWSRDYFHYFIVMLPAQLLERFRGVIERLMLARHIGMETLGIYVHSQQYAVLARYGMKAFANAIWSTSMTEAQEEDRRFIKTGQGWMLTHFLIALGGIFFAAIGRDIIALLTHGKFSEAYVFATLWMILVLLENTGKPMTAVIFAEKRASANQTLVFTSAGFSLAVLFAATPFWGVWGLVAAAFAQTLFYRLGLLVLSRRLAGLVFQDVVAAWGMLVVAGLLAVVMGFDPTFGERLLLGTAAALLLTVLCAPWLKDIYITARGLVRR